MAIDAAAPFVADVAIKVTLLFALAMAVTTAMRWASAASRYRVWIATLAAAGLLPVAAVTLPPVAVRVLAPAVPGASTPVLAATASKASAAFDTRTGTPGAISTVALAPPSPPHSSSRTSLTSLTSLTFWTGVVLAAWIGGFLLLAIRQLRGAFGARALVRSCGDAPGDVAERARVVAARIGLRRRVRIRIADMSVVPMTCGAMSPAIILPRVSRDWSGERLDAVLTHELAHCVRIDTLTDQIGQLAASLWWWHPLAWLTLHRARLDRERACDDRVLADGRRASDYAEDLVSIIETLASPKAALVAMGRRSHLEQRVDALLDRSINHRRASRTSCGLAAVVVAVSVVSASTHLAARAAEPLPPTSLDIALAAARVETPAATPRSAARHSVAGAITHATEVMAAAPPPQTAPPATAAPALTPADQQWRAERAEMLQELIDKAREHVQNVAAQVRIGTMAQIDEAEPEQLAEGLARDAADAAFTTGRSGSGAERAVTRARFDEAMRDLKKIETRFMVGLSNVHELDAALVTAADVLRKPVATPAEWDRPLSDAALATALKYVAAIPDDVARADALLTLAQHNAFSPDAVALYVQAAGAIGSAADRTRVFAQPIRVKPAGGG